MPWVKWNPLPTLFRIMVKPAEFAASTNWQHWANTDHGLKTKLSCEINSQPLLELLLHLCLDIDKLCCSNTIDQFITYPQCIVVVCKYMPDYISKSLGTVAEVVKNVIILITADFYSSMMAWIMLNDFSAFLVSETLMMKEQALFKNAKTQLFRFWCITLKPTLSTFVWKLMHSKWTKLQSEQLAMAKFSKGIDLMVDYSFTFTLSPLYSTFIFLILSDFASETNGC